MKLSNCKFTNLITLLCVISLLFGCGATSTDDGTDDNITLENPVGVTDDYDVVTLRNMYQTDVYTGSVNPQVTEYSFPKTQTFKNFGALPGTDVYAGDVLVYSQTKSVDKQITNAKEELEDFELNYQSEVEALNKDIEDAKKAEYDASIAVSEMYSWEPDEETNKGAYDNWAKLLMRPDSVYKRAKQNTLKLQEALKEKTELYNLEYDYKLKSIERLESKIVDASISSDTNGQVVSCGYYTDGDVIDNDVPVIAVGDMSTRIIKTDYVSKGTINNALDYYAVIDGNRYELDYEPIESDEYNQMVANGETVYSTFRLIDDTNTIEIGQYAVVVIVKDRRTQVPCVPIDALKKETDSYYVYLFDGTNSVYTPVTIGMKDGLYAEVISGLEVGDKVLSAAAPKKGKNTGEVTYGDYELVTDVGGYLYYPFSEWMVNPVSNGTTYVKEVLVTNNERVTKGQTLVTLEVISDTIEINRLTRQITRLQTRLVKLLKEKEYNDAKNITDRGLERSISDNQKQTNTYLRKLEKLKKYAGIINITAPYDGIVVDAEAVKAGDLLYEDSRLVRIADSSFSYIILKDEKKQYNYGTSATIYFNDAAKGQVTVEGTVATISNTYLSKQMMSEYALIGIPSEDAAAFLGTTQNSTGGWDRNNYKVKVAVRSMKNVLLVPKIAVTMKDRCTYVNVVDKNGNVSTVSFVAGGSDNNYYWVIEGLEEGMTVCWE